MRRAAVIAWSAMLVAAIALTVAVAIDDVLPGELRLLRELQTWGVLGGRFADAIRAITTTQVVAIAGAAIAVALWFAGERRHAAGLAAAVVLLMVAQPLIKEILDRPRPGPPDVDVRASITSPSFPAGHVMSPTAVYGYALIVAIARASWHRALRGAIVLGVAFVLVATGFVNLYLGVHWPTDVAGGWLWGGVIAVGVYLAVDAITRSVRRRRTRR